MTLQQNMPLFQSATGEPVAEQHPHAEHDEEAMRKLRNPFSVVAEPADAD